MSRHRTYESSSKCNSENDIIFPLQFLYCGVKNKQKTDSTLPRGITYTLTTDLGFWLRLGDSSCLLCYFLVSWSCPNQIKEATWKRKVYCCPPRLGTEKKRVILLHPLNHMALCTMPRTKRRGKRCPAQEIPLQCNEAISWLRFAGCSIQASITSSP